MESILTGLAVFTLFGSVFIFWFVATLALCLIIWSDVEDNGWWISFIFVAFVCLHAFSGNVWILDIFTLKNILIYLGAGFLFSLIRTYFKGKELKKLDEIATVKNNKGEKSTYHKDRFELKEHVFRWWLAFPICAINWIFTRLIKDLYNLIYKKLEFVYLKLFNA